jgi:hypothetical protein
MTQRRCVCLIVLAAFGANGCASKAIRPPSPATSLKVGDLLATPAPAGERYYLVVFGSQSTPKVPRHTHTWATVVRAFASAGRAEPALEVSTISWMPATLEIHPGRLTVEPGTNLTLEFTIQEMLRHKERIAIWGPYEIWHGNYQRFITQKAFLESGQIGYQCIDSVGEATRCGNGCDCIHAVTDMDPQFGRQHYPLRRFGEAASEYIVEQLLERPVVINAPQTHDWLIPALGLDNHPISRRLYTGVAVPFSPEAVLQQSMSAPGRH